MRRKSVRPANIASAQRWFSVVKEAARSQAAVMTLRPGRCSGPKGNEHPESEQVVFVVEGEVQAEIGEHECRLAQGDVIIVPRRAPHRFTNVSKRKAVTLNVYAPPAY